MNELALKMPDSALTNWLDHCSAKGVMQVFEVVVPVPGGKLIEELREGLVNEKTGEVVFEQGISPCRRPAQFTCWTVSGYDPLRLYLKQLKVEGVTALGLRYL